MPLMPGERAHCKDVSPKKKAEQAGRIGTKRPHKTQKVEEDHNQEELESEEEL